MKQILDPSTPCTMNTAVLEVWQSTEKFKTTPKITVYLSGPDSLFEAIKLDLEFGGYSFYHDIHPRFEKRSR